MRSMRIALVLLTLMLGARGARTPALDRLHRQRRGLGRRRSTARRRCAWRRPWSTARVIPRSSSRSRQSDGGRIVAARNEPGRMSKLSWFKAWEPDGTLDGRRARSTLRPAGRATRIRSASTSPPTARHMVYGYSNTSGFCCPISFGRGIYVRPVTNSSLEPIDRLGLGGTDTVRLARDRALRLGRSTSRTPSTPYESDFAPTG